MRALLVAAVMLSLLACNNAPPRPRVAPERAAAGPAIDPIRARQEVEEFFAAVAREDCSGIIGRLGTAPDEEHCREFLEDARRHQLRLLEVIEVQVDGRDPSAAVVRTGIEQGGRRRQVAVRVTHREGRWSLAL